MNNNKWYYTIDIKKEFQLCSNEKITIQKLSLTIHEKIEQLLGRVERTFPQLSDVLHDISDEFKMVSNDPDFTKDDFDLVLEKLYDWGDQPVVVNEYIKLKLCWISTRFYC